MDILNINFILKREIIYNEIKKILSNFEKNKFDLTLKRGIYIYGAPGSGKTEFITRLLKDINYFMYNENTLERITVNSPWTQDIVLVPSDKINDYNLN